MSKQMIIVTAVMCVGIFVGGCENDAQTASAIGALAGAGIGQLAGGDSEATLIGAAVGAGAGYMIGNEGDKKNAEVQMNSDMNAIRSQQNSVVVWVTNSNNSKVPVKLTRNGPGYVGPRGELYSKLPTQDQLRIVYGF